MMFLVLIITSCIFLIYVSIVSGMIYGFYKKMKQKAAIKQELQKITVIIPVRNESENISNCINSLIQQDYNIQNFEIIVVNDHSIDNTREIVESIIDKNKISIRFLNLENTYSKKEALKLGVNKAKYPIIATTDADCILPNKWLVNISRSLGEESNMMLGPVMFFKKKEFLAAFQTLDFSAIQGFTFGSAHYKKPILNNAANLAYLKKDLNSVGGYDNFKTPSGDDVFLLEKFKVKNLHIDSVLRKDFIVETLPENTWKSFFNQRIRWASKSAFYRDKFLIFISALIFISNILVLLVYFFIFFIEELRLLGIILLLSKWLIDFILLFLVTSFFERRNVLIYFIPVQLIYPLYIFIIGLASKFYQFEWKGRKVNE